MKRRTFLGRIGAAAGVLVAGAKAVAGKPDDARQLAAFNEGTRINARIGAVEQVAQGLGITEKQLSDDFAARRFKDCFNSKDEWVARCYYSD